MASPEHLTRAQWRDVAIAGYGPTLVSSIGFGAVLPLVPLTALRLGASVGMAAFIVGLVGLGTLVGDLPAGVIAARIGEKWSIVSACLLNAAVLGLAFAAHTLPVLALAVFLVGLNSAIFGVARQTFLTEAVPIRARGRALSTLGGVFRVGAFLGPLAGAGIVARWGLRPAFAFAAVMSLVAALVTLALPDVPREAGRTNAGRPRLATVLAAHRRTLLTIGIGTLAISLVRSGRQVLIPLFCDHLGLAPAETSLIYAASMACDVALFLPGGWLMDRVGRWWLCVPSTLVMSVGLLLFPLAHSAASVAAIAMLLGVGNGISSGIVMTLSSDASPVVGRPQFLAGMRLLSDGGNSAGPLLTALVTLAAPLAAAALLLGVLGLGGGAWLSRWVPRARDAHLRAG